MDIYRYSGTGVDRTRRDFGTLTVSSFVLFHPSGYIPVVAGVGIFPVSDAVWLYLFLNIFYL